MYSNKTRHVYQRIIYETLVGFTAVNHQQNRPK